MKSFVERCWAEMYLVFVIRPADGSLQGECAQEEKDRDQMSS